MGDEGAKSLAWALEKNATLGSLNLSSNTVGDEGAKSLASALEKNAALHAHGLDLRSNSVGDEGCKSLASALENNTTLHTLMLEFNLMGKEGAKTFTPRQRVSNVK